MKPKTCSEPQVFPTKWTFNISYPEPGEPEPRNYWNYETFSSMKTQFVGKGRSQWQATSFGGVCLMAGIQSHSSIISPTNMFISQKKKRKQIIKLYILAHSILASLLKAVCNCYPRIHFNNLDQRCKFLLLFFNNSSWFYFSIHFISD